MARRVAVRPSRAVAAGISMCSAWFWMRVCLSGAWHPLSFLQRSRNRWWKASGKSGGDPSGSSFPVRDGFFCAHLRIFEAHSGHQVNGGVADWRNGDRRSPLQFWKIRSHIHRNPEEAHRGSFPALLEPFAVGTEISGQRPEQLHAVARTRKDVIAGNHRLR